MMQISQLLTELVLPTVQNGAREKISNYNMEEKPLTKEEHNLHIATRFKKTQQEKEQAKAAKAAG